MAIQLPDWCRTMFLVLTGDGFPDGDEDQLRELAGTWRTAGNGLVGLIDEVNGATIAAITAFQGNASLEFLDAMRSLTAQEPLLLDSLARGCYRLADSIDKAALDIEYTKWLVIGQMVLLAAQIAWCIATSFFDFGLSLAAIPALQALGRTLAGRLIMQLVTQIVVGLSMQVGLDAAVQLAQFADGQRGDWDFDKTKSATYSGLVGAGVGLGLQPLFGGLKGIGNAAADAIENVGGKNLADTAGDAAGKAAANAADAAAKAAANAAGGIADSAAWKFTKSSLAFGTEVLQGGTHEWMTEYMTNGITQGEWDPTKISIFSLTAGGLEEVFEAMGRGIGNRFANHMSHNPFTGLDGIPLPSLDALSKLNLGANGVLSPQALAGLNQVNWSTANPSALAALYDAATKGMPLPPGIELPLAKTGGALPAVALETLGGFDFSRLTPNQLAALDQVDFGSLTPAAQHALAQVDNNVLTTSDLHSLARFDPGELSREARQVFKEATWTDLSAGQLAGVAQLNPSTATPASVALVTGPDTGAGSDTAPPPYDTASPPPYDATSPPGYEQAGSPANDQAGSPAPDTDAPPDYSVLDPATTSEAPTGVPPSFANAPAAAWEAMAGARSVYGQPLEAVWWQALAQVDLGAIGIPALLALSGQNLFSPPPGLAVPPMRDGSPLTPSAAAALSGTDWSTVGKAALRAIAALDLATVNPTVTHLASQLGTGGFTAAKAGKLASLDTAALTPAARHALSKVDFAAMPGEQLSDLAGMDLTEITPEALALLPQRDDGRPPAPFDPGRAPVTTVRPGVYQVEGQREGPFDALAALPELPGTLVLAVEQEHGRFRVGKHLVDPAQLADVIRELPDWRDGTRVVLVSGDALLGPAGSTLAEGLREELGTELVTTDPDGAGVRLPRGGGPAQVLGSDLGEAITAIVTQGASVAQYAAAAAATPTTPTGPTTSPAASPTQVTTPTQMTAPTQATTTSPAATGSTNTQESQASAETTTPPTGPTPVTLEELREAVQVVARDGQGKPTVISLRAPGEPVSEADQAAIDKLQAPAGHIAIDMHGANGVAYLGNRPVPAAVLDALLAALDLADRPRYLAICEAAAGPDPLAGQLAALRPGVPVDAATTTVYIDATTGAGLAVTGTVGPDGALTVTADGDFVRIVAPPTGPAESTSLGRAFPPGKPVDPATGTWVERMFGKDQETDDDTDDDIVEERNLSLPPYLTSGKSLGSAVVVPGTVTQVDAVLDAIGVTVPVDNLAHIRQQLEENFESFLPPSGRSFQFRSNGAWHEVQIEAALPPATDQNAVDLQQDPDGVTTKVVMTQQATASATVAASTGHSGAWSFNVEFGAPVGPVGKLAGNVVTSRPAVTHQTGTTVQDQRQILSGGGSVTATAPVRYAITLNQGTPVNVDGAVTVRIAEDLIGLETPDEVVTIDGDGAETAVTGSVGLDPNIAAKLAHVVPEALVPDEDPFGEIAATMHPSITALGAHGREQLQAWLNPTTMRNDAGEALQGWSNSVPLFSPHGGRVSSVSRKVVPVSAELVGVFGDASIRSQQAITTTLSSSTTTSSGFDITGGFGGQGTAGGAAMQGMVVGGYSTRSTSSTAAGGTAARRHGIQIKGKTGLYKVQVNLQTRTLGSAVIKDVPATAYLRLSLHEAAALGFPVPPGTRPTLAEPTPGNVYPPSYLAQNQAAGLYKTQQFDNADKVLDQVLGTLRAKGLIKSFDDPAMLDLSVEDTVEELQKLDELTAQLSPTALGAQLDSLYGAGVNVRVKIRRNLATNDYINITVKANPGAWTHEGSDAGRSVRGAGVNTKKLDSTGGTMRGLTGGLEFKIGGTIKTPKVNIGPTAQATAKYGKTTTRQSSSGPSVATTSLSAGSPSSQLFSADHTLDIEITKFSAYRAWTRKVPVGRPWAYLPGLKVLARTRRPDDTDTTTDPTLLDPITGKVAIWVPDSLTRKIDLPVNPPAAPVIDPLPAKTTISKIRNAAKDTPFPKINYVVDVLDAKTLRDQAVNALTNLDPALTLPGSASRNRINQIFTPENLATILPKLGTTGERWGGFDQARRLRDTTAALGVSVQLGKPTFVKLINDAPTENASGATYSVGSSKTKSKGLAVDVGGAFNFKALDKPVTFGTGITGKVWSKQKGSTQATTLSGGIERTTATSAPTRSVLVQFDAAFTIVAESKRSNLLAETGGKVVELVKPGFAEPNVDGSVVTLPGGVLAEVSEAQAREWGLLPPLQERLTPDFGATLSPPSTLAAGVPGSLGLGAVEDAPDLLSMLPELREGLGKLGPDLMPAWARDDAMRNIERLLTLVSKDGVTALVDSALDGGVPVHAYTLGNFGRDAYQVVLEAIVTDPPTLAKVTNDDGSVSFSSTKSVKTSGTQARVGNTGVTERNPANRVIGPAASNPVALGGAVSSGVGRDKTVSVVTSTEEKQVYAGSVTGPMAHFDVPVRFRLSVRKGTELIASVSVEPGALDEQDDPLFKVSVPADSVVVTPDGEEAPKPIGPTPKPKAADPASTTDTAIATWLAEGVTLPEHLIPWGFVGAKAVQNAAVLALTNAGAGGQLTGEGTAALNAVRSGLSSEMLRADLKDRTSAPLEIPLHGVTVTGGQHGTVKVYSRVVAPKLTGISDTVTIDSAISTADSVDTSVNRLDNSDFSSGPAASGSGPGKSAGGGLTFKRGTTHLESDTVGFSASRSDNIKPSGRTALLGFDVEYLVIADLGDGKTAATTVKVPGSAQLAVGAGADTLGPVLGKELTPALATLRDQLTAAAEAWAKAEAKVTKAIHRIDDEALAGGQLITPPQSDAGSINEDVNVDEDPDEITVEGETSAQGAAAHGSPSLEELYQAADQAQQLWWEAKLALDTAIAEFNAQPVTTGDPTAPPSPVTLDELRNAMKIVKRDGGGVPTLIRFRAPGHLPSKADARATANLIVPDGHVGIDMHGADGVAYLGDRPVPAKVLHDLLAELKLPDVPLYLAICEAAKGDGSLAEQLAEHRPIVPVTGATTAVFVNADTGESYAADGTVNADGSLDVTRDGTFAQLTYHLTGARGRQELGPVLPTTAQVDTDTGTWVKRMHEQPEIVVTDDSVIIPDLTLPPYLAAGTSLGSAVVVPGTVTESAAVVDAIGGNGVTVPDEDLAHIKQQLEENFESFLPPSGRSFQIKSDGQWREVRIEATLPPPTAAGTVDVEHDPGDVTTKLVMSQQATASATVAASTSHSGAWSFNVEVGAPVGAVGKVGGTAVTSRPSVTTQTGTTVQDQRQILSGGGSVRATVPVRYTITWDNTPETTVGVDGTVAMRIAEDLIGLTASNQTEPDQVVTIDGTGTETPVTTAVNLDASVAAKLAHVVPEALVPDTDPFTTIAATMHPSITAIGSPGREQLQHWLNGTTMRNDTGEALQGWSNSVPLFDRHGSRVSSVSRKVVPVSAELVGVFDKASIRAQQAITTTLTSSSSTSSGFDLTAGLGGQAAANGVGLQGLAVGGYSTRSTGSSSAGGTSSRRHAIQIKGDTGLYKVRVNIQVKTLGSPNLTTVPATAYLRLSLHEAAALGFPVPPGTRASLAAPTTNPVHPPAYLAQNRAAGLYKTQQFDNADKVLDQVLETLRRHGLLRSFDDPAITKLSVPDILEELEKLDEITAQLSPTALGAQLDSLYGAGVNVRVKVKRSLVFNDYVNITVRATPGAWTHEGAEQDRSVRGAGATTRKLDSAGGTARGGSGGVEFKVGKSYKVGGTTITPAGQASAKYSSTTTRQSTSGPSVATTSLSAGSPSSQLFSADHTLDVEITKFSAYRAWTRKVSLGRPWAHLPDQELLGRTRRPDDPEWASWSQLEPITGKVAIWVPDGLTRKLDVPVTPPAPTVINPLPANTTIRSMRNDVQGTPFPKLNYVVGVLDAGTLRDQAVNAMNQLDPALTLPGGASRNRIDQIFAPENLATILTKLGTTGERWGGFNQARRVTDTIADLGVSVQLGNPAFVKLIEDAPTENASGATYTVGSSTTKTKGFTADLGTGVTFKLPPNAPTLGTAVSGKVWSKQKGSSQASTLSGGIERTTATNAPTRSVLVQLDATFTIVAEATRTNLLGDATGTAWQSVGGHAGRPKTSGSVVTVPGGVVAEISETQAREWGLLPPLQERPAPEIDATVSPPPTLTPDQPGSLGVGTVDEAPDLLWMLPQLRASLGKLGAGLMPRRAVKDTMRNVERILTLISPDSVTALVDSALDGGVPVHAYKLDTFGRDTYQIVLEATVVGQPVPAGVTNDDASLSFNSSKAVKTSGTQAKVGSTGIVERNPAGRTLGPAGTNPVTLGGSLSTGVGRDKSVSVVSSTEQKRVYAGSVTGPMAHFDVPVRFSLSVRKGNETIVTVPVPNPGTVGPAPQPQQLKVSVPADGLVATPTGVPATDPPGPPPPPRPVDPTALTPEAIAAWQGKSLQLPEHLIPWGFVGAKGVQDAALLALANAGAGKQLTGDGTAAISAIRSGLSSEMLRADLKDRTTGPLEIPLHGTPLINGQSGTLRVYSRVLAPKLSGLSDTTTIDSTQSTADSVDTAVNRVDNSDLSTGFPAISHPGYGAASGSGSVSFKRGTTHAEGDTSGFSASRSDNIKPSGRTALVGYDVEYLVVADLGGGRLGGATVRAPRSAQVAMSASAEVLEPVLGKKLTPALATLRDELTDAAKAWAQAEAEVAKAIRRIDDRWLVDQDLITPPDSNDGSDSSSAEETNAGEGTSATNPVDGQPAPDLAALYLAADQAQQAWWDAKVALDAEIAYFNSQPQVTQDDGKGKQNATDQLTVPEPNLPPTPATLDQLRAAARVLRTDDNGAPALIQLRPPATQLSDIELQATTNLVVPDGHVAIDMHGAGGVAYLGDQPVPAELLDELLAELGAGDKPRYLAICEAAKGPGSLAAKLASRRPAIPVTGATTAVFINADTGESYAADAKVNTTGGLDVVAEGEFRQLTYHPTGVTESVSLTSTLLPGAAVDPNTGNWVKRLHEPPTIEITEHSQLVPGMSLPPYLSSGESLGSAVALPGAVAETATAVTAIGNHGNANGVTVPADVLAEIQLQLEENFESFLGRPGRRFQFESGGTWHEVSVLAQLPLATNPESVEVTEDPEGVNTKTVMTEQVTATASVSTSTGHSGGLSFNVDFGAPVGPVGRLGGTVPSARATVTAQTGIGIQDQRQILSGDGSSTVKLPVAYTIGLHAVTGGTVGQLGTPATANGTVSVRIAKDLTKMTPPDKVATLQGGTLTPVGKGPVALAADLGPKLAHIVPEVIVPDSDPFDTVAPLLHRSITDLGAPGREQLRDWLNPTTMRNEAGEALHGWSNSTPLFSTNNDRVASLRRKVEPVSAELVGVFGDASIRSQQGITTTLSSSSTSSQGFDLAGGFGGQGAVNGVGLQGLAVYGYSARSQGSSSTGGSATRRHAMQIKGETGLYKVRVNVVHEALGGGQRTVPATAYVRLGLHEAAELGFPVPEGTRTTLAKPTDHEVHPPPYLSAGRGAGLYKTQRFDDAHRVLDQVLGTLRSNGLLKSFDDPAMLDLSVQDVLEELEKLDEITAQLSPTALGAQLDSLYGAGVTVRVKIRRDTFTNEYVNITVKARPGDWTHAGREDDRSVRGAGATSRKLDSSGSSTRGHSIGAEFKLGRPVKINGVTISPSYQAIAKYGASTTHSLSGGPSVSTTSTNAGSSASHLFSSDHALDIEITRFKAPRAWTRRLSFGLPGVSAPTPQVMARTRRPEDPTGPDPSLLDPIVSHVSVWVPEALTHRRDPTGQLPGAPTTAPLPPNTTIASVREAVKAAPMPDLQYVVGVLDAQALRDEAVRAMSSLDPALGVKGSASRNRIDQIFTPENLATILPKLGTTGESWGGFNQARRIKDTNGNLGLTVQVGNPQFVTLVDTPTENASGATYTVGGSKAKTSGWAVDMGASVNVTPKPYSSGAGLSTKVFSKQKGSTEAITLSGGIERTKATNSPTRSVLVQLDATFTIVAEAHRGNMYSNTLDSMRKIDATQVDGGVVTVPVLVEVSQEQARAWGMLPALQARPVSNVDATLDPPSTLTPNQPSSLGVGTVEKAPDLTSLLPQLRTSLGELGKELMPRKAIKDTMRNMERMLTMVSKDGVSALVDSALDGGVPVHAYKINTFTRDTYQVVLEATVSDPAKFAAVTNDDASISFSSTKSLKASGTKARVGSTGVSERNPANRLTGPTGSAPTAIGGSGGVGVGRDKAVSVVTATEEKRVYAGSVTGPIAHFDVPVQFTLSVRKGNETVASVSLPAPLTPDKVQDQQLTVGIPADSLVARPSDTAQLDGTAQLGNAPAPPAPTPANPAATTATAIAAWQAGGVQLPQHLIPWGFVGAKAVQQAADVALTAAGASPKLTGDGTAAMNAVRSGLSSEMLRADLRDRTTKPLEIPLHSTSVIGSQRGSLKVYSRLVGPRLVELSDTVTIDSTLSTTDSVDTTLNRMDNSDLAGAPAFSGSDAAVSGAGNLTGKRNTAHVEGKTVTNSASRSDNVKPSGRTALVGFDVEYLVVADLGDGRTGAANLTLPQSAQVTMDASAALLNPILGTPLPAELRTLRDELTGAAKDWAQAEAAVAQAIRDIDDRWLREQGMITPDDSKAPSEKDPQDGETQPVASTSTNPPPPPPPAAEDGPDLDTLYTVANDAQRAWWEAKLALDAAIAAYNGTPAPEQKAPTAPKQYLQVPSTSSMPPGVGQASFAKLYAAAEVTRRDDGTTVVSIRPPDQPLSPAEQQALARLQVPAGHVAIDLHGADGKGYLGNLSVGAEDLDQLLEAFGLANAPRYLTSCEAASGADSLAAQLARLRPSVPVTAATTAMFINADTGAGFAANATVLGGGGLNVSAAGEFRRITYVDSTGTTDTQVLGNTIPPNTAVDTNTGSWVRRRHDPTATKPPAGDTTPDGPAAKPDPVDGKDALRAALTGTSGLDPAVLKAAVSELPPTPAQFVAALPIEPGRTAEETVAAWAADPRGVASLTSMSGDPDGPHVLVTFAGGAAHDASALLGWPSGSVAVLPSGPVDVELMVPDWPAPGSALVTVAPAAPEVPGRLAGLAARLRQLVADAATSDWLSARYAMARSALFDESWGSLDVKLPHAVGAQAPPPTELEVQTYQGWMYTTTGIPLEEARPGAVVRTTGFIVASADPGVIPAGAPLGLAIHGTALDLSANDGLPPGTHLLIPPRQSLRVVEVTGAGGPELRLTLVQ